MDMVRSVFLNPKIMLNKAMFFKKPFMSIFNPSKKTYHVAARLVNLLENLIPVLWSETLYPVPVLDGIVSTELK